MSAFNAVRFRVKPGREKDFLDARIKNVPGRRIGRACGTPTSSRPATMPPCIIAEWTDVEALVQARPKMVATLNSFRDTLEDLGGGVGVTDASVRSRRHAPE